MLGATLQAMAQQTTVTTPQMVFVQKPTDPLEAPAFLSEKELPDHSKYIPAPPEVGTEAFQNDVYYYKWGKEQRLMPRAAQAALDETQWTSKAFSAAAGFTISPKDCPEIFKLVDGSQKDAKICRLIQLPLRPQRKRLGICADTGSGGARLYRGTHTSRHGVCHEPLDLRSPL